jgi:hypothetical protein
MNELTSASGVTVIPAARVRVSRESVPIGGPRPAEPRGEPKVHLVRDGGVIRAIEVICACGELIRIRCEYS